MALVTRESTDRESFGELRRRIPLPGSGGIAVLLMADGTARLAHDCDRRPSNPHRHARFRSNDAGEHRIAPLLQLDNGHTIVSEQPLTVTPSVMCDDCGLHGFVMAGRWVRA